MCAVASRVITMFVQVALDWCVMKLGFRLSDGTANYVGPEVSGAQSQTFCVSAVQAREFFVIARMFYTQKLRPGNHQQFPKYFVWSHFDFQIAVLGVNYLKNCCFSLGFLSKSKVLVTSHETFDLLRKPKEKQRFFK